MTRTPSEAVAWGDSVESGYLGLCLQFCRDCYDVGPLYSCADEDWYGTGKRHETSDPSDAPYGALLHFHSPTSPQYGHIAINVGGGMMLTTSDSHGGPTRMPVSQWVAWGYRLRGWKSRINDVEVLDGDNSSGGEDPMPEYKNMAWSGDERIAADEEWHTLHIGDGLVTLLHGPAEVEGVLTAYVSMPDGTGEFNLRAVHMDHDPDGPDKLVQTSPFTSMHSSGGTSQLAMPFTEHVTKPASGYTSRRLRFQIRGWGGGTMVVNRAAARCHYWE